LNKLKLSPPFFPSPHLEKIGFLLIYEINLSFPSEGPTVFNIYFTPLLRYFQPRDEGDSRCCGNDKKLVRNDKKTPFAMAENTLLAMIVLTI
jgi:hypothetical protein